MRRFRDLSLLLLLLFALPACPAMTKVGKWTGLIRPPTFPMPDTVPQDFELVVHVTDQQDPPIDYLLTFRRTGNCNYSVTPRSPRRPPNEGGFEVLENQISALWSAVLAAKYDELDSRYPEDGIGDDRAAGVQSYKVQALDFPKEVQAQFLRLPELEKIRTLALSYVPARAFVGAKSSPLIGTKVREVIGDLRTKLFYPPEDPRLKDVPNEARQPFPTWHDAVNYGFSPSPGFEPWAVPRSD